MKRDRLTQSGGGLLGVFAALALSAPAAAQNTCPCPPTPKPGWAGSVGAGLSLNSGNSDTKSYNLDAGAVYDPQTKNLLRLSGLYLRSDSRGAATIDKSALGAHDEYTISGRGFLFGEVGYQRDRLKGLDYLLSPSLGVGYKLVAEKRVTLATDGGVGLAIEKLTSRASTTGGSLRVGQSLTYQISDSASFRQSFGAIWKVSDFADAYYHLEADLTTSVARRLDLKLAYITDIKNKPASAGLEERDSAIVAAVVFKFRPS